MAELEAAAPVPDPVEVPEAPAQEDDKIKRPPKRIPKPSKADYESKTNALYQTIKERKERIDVITDNIKSKRTNTESAAMKAVKTEINDLRAQWNAELVRAGLPFILTQVLGQLPGFVTFHTLTTVIYSFLIKLP